MSQPPPEPRNPFYLLLLLVSFLFVLTALAYAVVPTLEEKATAAGEPPPPSEVRDALRNGLVAASTLLARLDTLPILPEQRARIASRIAADAALR